MELRHLRYFIAVAEELHFRRAAERLRISQPPLSLQIADLERELGAKLFDRTSQKVSLTPAGKVLLTHAYAVLDRVAAAARDVRLAADGEIGDLRIAYTQSFEFLHLLPEAIRRFGARYPKVSIALEQMKTADQLAALAERRLDLGISRKPARAVPRDVVFTRLLDDPLMLAVSQSNPLAGERRLPIAAARDMPFIISPGAELSGLRDTTLQLCRRARFAPRIAQEAREVPTMLGLVAANVGVAVVPASARHMSGRGVAFVEIDDPRAESAIYMVTTRSGSNRLVAELAGLLEDAARQAD